MADRPTVCVRPISSHLTCNVCQKLFRDPVINVKCGHTFCRHCLLSQLSADKSSKCPLDDVTCDLDQLVINRALQGQLDELDIYCCHGLIWHEEAKSYTRELESGCPQIIKYGDREQHEDVCDYAIVVCPNGGEEACGKYRKRDLASHLSVCCFHKCTNENKGCDFCGSQGQLIDHLVICGFRGLQSDDASADKIDALVKHIEELKKTVGALTTRVTQLEQDKQDQQDQLRQCTSLFPELNKKYEMLAEKVTWSATNSPPGSDAWRRNMEYGFGRPQAYTATRNLRRLSSSSSVGGAKIKTCNWTMPFQFKCIGTLRGHRDSVFTLQRHKGLLFSAGADQLIKVWDLELVEKGCQNTLQGHTGNVMALAVGPSFLYSGGADLSLRAWSLEDLSQLHIVEGAHEKIIAAMVCTDDFLFTSSHTEIKVWEAASLTALHTISGLYHWVRSLALSVNKDVIYSGSHNTIEIWNTLGKFNLKGKISHTHGSVYCLAVTDKYIIAGTYNMNTHVYDSESQEYVRKLSGHIGAITSLAVTPCGRFLFTGSSDATAQLWSLENFLPIQSLARHNDTIHSVLLYNDLFLSASEDHEIKVFKYFKMQPGFVPA